VTNQLFVLSTVVGVTGDSHSDCVVLTFVAPPPLGNNLPVSYTSLHFVNLSDNVAI